MEVLCFACRHAPDDHKVQHSLTAFFTQKEAHSDTPATATENPGSSSAEVAPLLCSKCRRSMTKHTSAAPGTKSVGGSRVLPQIARIRNYQRVAEQQGVPFVIPEHTATALMREPCTICGVAAPAEGHGLTRLRIWPDGVLRPARGGFMGPFHECNVASACGMCNLMKGYRRIRSFVNMARTIATHRGGAGDFGRFPEAFRNNISRRSRSSYISASSTHTKTHALTNEAFARIVSQPCRFCGKPHDPPRHYNGLDRLDSACRVYTEDTCVACCGDCNMVCPTDPQSHSQSQTGGRRSPWPLWSAPRAVREWSRGRERVTVPLTSAPWAAHGTPLSVDRVAPRTGEVHTQRERVHCTLRGDRETQHRRR